MIHEDIEQVRELAERIRRARLSQSSTPGTTWADVDFLNRLADAAEYENLVECFYPGSMTLEVALKMRELERRLQIETLIP